MMKFTKLAYIFILTHFKSLINHKPLKGQMTLMCLSMYNK